MKKLLKYLLLFILGLALLSVLWVVVLKWIPVARTPLMDKRAREYRQEEGFKSQRKWVKLDNISDEMIMAVMASEDTRFLSHDGFDRIEIQNALADIKAGKRFRGASTISQQTAKNVFLPSSRSWVRKGFEAYFTFLIEKIWGKRRIMEVYLNVIETGKGCYGVEAAAQRYFGVSASKLTARQAALIAASLPNPLKRDPAHPTVYLRTRSGQIMSLMKKIPRPDWL